LIDRFTSGIVGAPFGIKGFVKVKPLSGETKHLLRIRSVTLRQDGGERLLNIEESALSGGKAAPFLVMRFSGYDSPEAAKALCGAELLVDRENAAPLNKGEYYIEDLKGLEVYTYDGGEIIGHINGITEGGGADIAEIRLNNGKLKLIPFRKEFFPEINPEEGRVVLQNLWILE